MNNYQEMFDFNKYQDVLFPFAYNILGSTDDAKDAIQDTLNNFISSSKNEIENPKAYLIKSVINTSINKKNRKKKFISNAITLPEPIATDTADNEINMKDIVSYSLLILLEELNVKERAVFILKEAFNYSHKDIAEVLSSTTENSRKLLSRAKLKLKDSNPSKKIFSDKKTNEYLESYISAIRNRDIRGLENLFTNDIAVVADGGDEIKVLKNFSTGKEECIELLIMAYEKFQSQQDIKFVEVNHQPAILYFNDGLLSACQIFSINAKQKINKISSVLDSKKLKNIAQLIS